ncbi:hypothetical protein ACA910_006929 [Epithemia clementina (nom. ined.)]
MDFDDGNSDVSYHPEDGDNNGKDEEMDPKLYDKVEEEYTQDNQPVIVDDDSDDAHDDASNREVEPVPADDEESTGVEVHKL